MNQSGASPSGPLYQLRQGASTRTGRNTTITGAHVSDKNTGGTTGARNNYINGTSRSDSAFTSTWFTLHSGDVVVLKLKNISYTNSYTSGTASYTVSLRDISNTAFGVGQSFSLPRGNSSGTFADTTTTVTLEADYNISCVYFYAQRASTMEYDLELWVNDIRYI